ncbi:hypothetical protein [Bacillus sp. T33-2]|uniref:hypothetical protein n=1 Tax=Bacillus sp. T33-2 TaxID=2054168 RepID=UPI000C77BD81|nr:hypothetical protein [Bacillus sp. T33-2]PLR99556.1 hypothetical protein CVD19_00400 [Bacillus sp. T33-2]
MMTLGFMFVAGILHMFNVDEVVVEGLNELTGKRLSAAVYWLTFLVVGLGLDIIATLVNVFN